MSRLAAVLLALTLSACVSNGRRIDELAQSAGLSRTLVHAGSYPALIYEKAGQTNAGTSAAPAPLAVYLEGDGLPWRDGLEPSVDPTTRNPMALKLMMRAPAPGAYITRPCYHELRTGRCTPERWTSARYSEEVARSMAATVREAARRAGTHEVVLIGYSGGGALAVLIAERLDNVAAVITIGANLDTQAWTTLHGYLPLAQSLNPAGSTRRHPWPEIHLHGARDTVVPPSTTAVYFKRYPAARHMIIDGYDHVCCWLDRWPSLLAEIRQQIEAARPAS